MNTMSMWTTALPTVVVSALIMAQSAQALPVTTLHSFDGTDGSEPLAGLTQGINGDFYGTTSGFAVLSTYGTVFKITPSGKLTTLHTFDGTDGQGPTAVLILATNGDFYGTTGLGGANDNAGTVFKITPGGTLTSLYSFCSQTDCADGDGPAALIQAANGDFYGTTPSGGAHNDGTFFKMTPGGTLTTLYSFDKTDGEGPYGVIQATNGTFFGTTSAGGANGGGTVFKITPAGALTTLYSFCSQAACADGKTPAAGLIQGADGNFYGTTSAGGAQFYFGTVFKITPGGTLTTLHSFDKTDGAFPMAGLIQATDGNFYGTTSGSGTAHGGTLFEITSGGTLTTLVRIFDAAALLQGTNGELYGATAGGGANNDGIVFRLSVGLGPFVDAQPSAGAVGAAVKILGTDLLGSTSVTFNDTAATFTVVSASEITTSVPAGATTGLVEVTTLQGTLDSNKIFTVKP